MIGNCSSGLQRRVQPGQSHVDESAEAGLLGVVDGVGARDRIGVDTDQRPVGAEHREQPDLTGAAAQLEHRPRRCGPDQLGGPPGLLRGPRARTEDTVVEGDLELAEAHRLDHGAGQYPDGFRSNREPQEWAGNFGEPG